MIPKIIIQTSKYGIPIYVSNMIKQLSKGWEYKHFDDNQIIQFFIENPIPEFLDICEKFYSFHNGAYRSDLFRYYYLYINGGVYIDSDAMIEIPLDQITRNYDFFSCKSDYVHESVFQGFIGCIPKNKIIYEALKNIYYIDNNIIQNDYFIIVKNLYKIVQKYKNSCKIKLFEEVYGDEHYSKVLDKNIIILKHYYKEKIIPYKNL